MATLAELFNVAWNHHQAGDLSQAEQLYRQIIEADPTHADSHHCLGVLCYQLGRYVQATHSLRQAIQFWPSFPAAHYALAMALAELDKLDEAVEHYRRALGLNPQYVEAHNNLADLLLGQGQPEQAIAHWKEALRFRPDAADVHNNLAAAFEQLGNIELAEAHCQEALRLNPAIAEPHNNLGNVLLAQKQVDKAMACFREALRLNPNFAPAHNNLGNALVRQANWDEALIHFREALRLKPDFPGARLNRGLVLLAFGDTEQGWPDYDFRFDQPGVTRRQFQQPLWDGSDLVGRPILLYAEQGIGDTFQFIRYAPLVKRRGGQVIVECQPALSWLLDGVPGVDSIVARGSPLPTFDFQAPLMSLPGIFRTMLDTIPATIPYLKPRTELVEKWRRELSGYKGFKIGIAWQGSLAYGYDSQRSIGLTNFARLAGIDGLHLISLQKGYGEEQLSVWPRPNSPVIVVDNLDEEAGAFMDTAAIMKNLDLVICSDSAVAHLAGALGVSVWVALPKVPDWRWLLKRADSPWYPTMRLFRQTRFDIWDDVFDQILEAVEQQIKHS